jgi:hypothetical protein
VSLLPQLLATSEVGAALSARPRRAARQDDRVHATVRALRRPSANVGRRGARQSMMRDGARGRAHPDRDPTAAPVPVPAPVPIPAPAPVPVACVAVPFLVCASPSPGHLDSGRCCLEEVVSTERGQAQASFDRPQVYGGGEIGDFSPRLRCARSRPTTQASARFASRTRSCARRESARFESSRDRRFQSRLRIARLSTGRRRPYSWRDRRFQTRERRARSPTAYGRGRPRRSAISDRPRAARGRTRGEIGDFRRDSDALARRPYATHAVKQIGDFRSSARAQETMLVARSAISDARRRARPPTACDARGQQIGDFGSPARRRRPCS